MENNEEFAKKVRDLTLDYVAMHFNAKNRCMVNSAYVVGYVKELKEAPLDISHIASASPAVAAVPDLSGLTDERIEGIIARIGSQSLNVTRMHELGGKTTTIMESDGVLEFARAIEREVLTQQAQSQQGQSEVKPFAYLPKCELAKLDDPRLGGVGMMVSKEPKEGRVAIYLAPVPPVTAPAGVSEDDPAEMMKRWPTAQAFIDAHTEEYFESNEPVPRLHLAYAVDLLTDALAGDVAAKAARWDFMMCVADDGNGPEAQAMEKFGNEAMEEDRPESEQMNELVDKAIAFVRDGATPTVSPASQTEGEGK